MSWPFHHKELAIFWVKVFALYAITEAFIQLLFLYILNNYGDRPISNWEFHTIMWVFQCLLIWPIWYVAWLVKKRNIFLQVLVNVLFYLVYSQFWFGPVQDLIAWLHQHLQALTRPAGERLVSPVDQGSSFAYLNYQLLKHGFRLSIFYIANYFYHYRQEEQKRTELATANKDLQLRLLKWHLNPEFYFKTIDQLRQLAAQSPANCSGPILQLAKVMEYVIYEVKEKWVEVKKEIQFLRNYLELVNRQAINKTGFSLVTTGDYDGLKIAPLLLAGVVDKLSTIHERGEPVHVKLQLEFAGAEMVCEIENDAGLPLSKFFNPGELAYKRFEETYPGNFTCSYPQGESKLKFSLQLDEKT
ncbi:MAG TPA: histidine kinase [Chitinophagaceae bacterium]|nr:histidine kinase [Chitinophagaceae bacterium]